MRDQMSQMSTNVYKCLPDGVSCYSVHASHIHAVHASHSYTSADTHTHNIDNHAYTRSHTHTICNQCLHWQLSRNAVCGNRRMFPDSTTSWNSMGNYQLCTSISLLLTILINYLFVNYLNVCYVIGLPNIIRCY